MADKDRPHELAAPANAGKAGFAYFAVVFAAGFALGIVRTLWAEPRFGARTAELMEMPIMAAAIVLGASWTVRCFGLPPSLSIRLAVGFTALALLLLAEIALVSGVRGITISDYVASRDPVSGTVYLAMLLFFAAMPALVRRRRSK